MTSSPFGQNSTHPVVRLLQDFFCMVMGSKQKLFGFLQQCCKKGILSQSSLRMIEGVLHISEMRARDIMIPRMQMVVISKDASLEEIYEIVISSGHSRFPVLNESTDAAEGFLLAKDLLRYHAHGSHESFRLKDHLHLPSFVPESKRLGTLLNDFRRTRNHMAIVVDEYGGISGLMTIEDVLEQIVGDITDEHDSAEDEFVQAHGDGRYMVKALMPLADFNEYFLVDLDVQRADTIGGYLIQTLGHFPKRGEKKQISSLLIEVSRADVRRVHSLLITRESSA